MKAIILAGGIGIRLWPLSRKNHPKQFLKLYGDRSLLQLTVERLLYVLRPEDIVIITNSEYKTHVLSDLNSLSLDYQNICATNIILEPAGRNTAPAIALGIKYCVEKLGCSKNEVVLVCPSDHMIKPADGFSSYINKAEDIAKDGNIVTFGVKPDRPETGYGYIKVREQKPTDKDKNFLKVENFTEKPNAETAKKYIEEGNYYWNSGMFAFSIGTMIEEFQQHAADISKMLELSFDDMTANFAKMTNISIDYAVMEKSNRVITLPLELYWNDIGSWDSLYDVLNKDESGNVIVGDVYPIDTKNSLIIGNKRIISTIGLEDHLIIETEDAILIAKRGEAQKVKDIVDKIKRHSRKGIEDHSTTL